LVLAAVALFVGDVFVRRVAFEWTWLVAPFAWMMARLRSNRGRIVAPQYMERLRSRKEEVNRTIGERRETVATASPSSPPVSTRPQPPKAPVAVPPPEASQPEPEAKAADDYTSRLLEAKRKVQQRRRTD
jgi:hypothetical protein